MSDVAPPVTLRLRPADGSDLYFTVRRLCQAGRLGKILGAHAPRSVALTDGSLIFVGPDLFVLFGTEDDGGLLEVTIGRSRLSELSAEAFTATATLLGRNLLRFLLAVLDVAQVDGPAGSDIRPAARAVCDSGQVGPMPVRGGRRRPAPGAAPRIALAKPRGHGVVKGLPSQTELRQALRPAPSRLTVPPLSAAMFALPVVVALAWAADFATRPAPELWSAGGVELTDYQPTSAVLDSDDPGVCR